MKQLIPLTEPKHIKQLIDAIDKWKELPSNRQLLSPSDDFPQLVFADSRPSDIQEVAELLGQPIRYDYYDRDCYPKDFVSLDDDGNVDGYFHYLLSEHGNNMLYASGVRTYRFGSSPYRYGKAQKEFYDYLDSNHDLIGVLFVANADFTMGKADINGNDVVSESKKRIAEKNELIYGFANPQYFRRLTEGYGAIFTPYVVAAEDLDGNVRFLHSLEWLGSRPNKAISRLSLSDPDRSDYTINQLIVHGLEQYL